MNKRAFSDAAITHEYKFIQPTRMFGTRPQQHVGRFNHLVIFGVHTHRSLPWRRRSSLKHRSRAPNIVVSTEIRRCRASRVSESGISDRRVSVAFRCHCRCRWFSARCRRALRVYRVLRRRSLDRNRRRWLSVATERYFSFQRRFSVCSRRRVVSTRFFVGLTDGCEGKFFDAVVLWSASYFGWFVHTCIPEGETERGSVKILRFYLKSDLKNGCQLFVGFCSFLVSNVTLMICLVKKTWQGYFVEKLTDRVFPERHHIEVSENSLNHGGQYGGEYCNLKKVRGTKSLSTGKL